MTKSKIILSIGAMSSSRAIIEALLALAMLSAVANSAPNDADRLAVGISSLRVQLRQVEPKGERCRLLATDLAGDKELSSLLQTAGVEAAKSNSKLLVARELLKQRLDQSASSSRLRVLIDWLDECIRELEQPADRKDNKPGEILFTYDELARIHLPKGPSSNERTTTPAPTTTTVTNSPQLQHEQPEVDIDGLIEASTWKLQLQIDLLTDKLDNKQATIEKLEARIGSLEAARNANRAEIERLRLVASAQSVASPSYEEERLSQELKRFKKRELESERMTKFEASQWRKSLKDLSDNLEQCLWREKVLEERANQQLNGIHSGIRY